MRNKIVPIALAAGVVFATTSAQAYEVRRLRDSGQAPAVATQPAQVETTGETAPNVFGSTTSHPSANASARAEGRRSLNAQIRTLQRQYLNAVRTNDPRAEQYRVELERLRAQRR